MSLRITVSKNKQNEQKPWLVRWFGGEYNHKTGKQKRCGKSFKYKHDAEDFRTEMRAAFSNGELSESEKKGTLSELCKYWLRTQERTQKIGTTELYQGTFCRLKDYFGAYLPLKQITPLQAELFVAQQRNRSRYRKGQLLSESSRNQIVRSSRALFAAGKKWGYIRTNPFEDIKTPDPEQKRFHRFTPEQERALLREAPNLRVRTLYAILLATGVRLGAAITRIWEDFDLEHGQLNICNRQGSDALPPFTIKTKKGVRPLPLSPYVLELLIELKAEASKQIPRVPLVFLTRERYERTKAKWHKCRADGIEWKTRWLMNNIRRDFLSTCARAGIKPTGQLTIHTLRKNAGQNLADAGLPPKVVQTILGHTRAETTMKYYNQVDKHHEQQVREATEKRLNPENSTNSSTSERFRVG